MEEEISNFTQVTYILNDEYEIRSMKKDTK